MKTYGNSRSDGFPLLLAGFGVLFVVGGIGLSFAGGPVLVPGVLAVFALGAVALRLIARWDVMSEAAGLPKQLDATAARFTMPAETDARAPAQPAMRSWRPASTASGALPMPVNKPAGGVVTNTPVA